ncbi:DUF4255 domain-containing protein [Cellvibrio sp. NN19]|uniref:DUF4255 domain-containing protein n=1 Tax=Cellvibrio chitinivorans TaxID=3102792 RepID=UPI002B4101CB|nr:DUF4255 domain-containing protein [Cellvibrio sp. NN19]
MALPDSSLYLACKALVDGLEEGIQANTHEISISMGSPADIASKTDENRLNLFFYRFEPSGFQAGVHPNEPWRIRMFVLVTCMTKLDQDQGLEDLRLLGMVMSYFNEHRLMPQVTIGTEQLRLQVVFVPASEEQLNQIWSTQGDTSYRPSVIYEVSLAPIMPTNLRGEPPRVGFTGLETRADMRRRFEPFAGSLRALPVSRHAVNSANPAWTPVICWVEGDACSSVLSIDVDAVDPATVKPRLWVAGQAGASISLEWQVWQDERWNEADGGNLVISSAAIEPESIPVGLPTIDLPTLTLTDAARWQLLLYAVRSYQAFSGGPSITLRSNPLLITLYREATE